jgi:3-phenylpropionate/trans-cinnamate dioxygenase ferredoxin component
MARFVTVAKTSDVEPGQVKYISVEDYQLAICNVDGAFHCIENVCTHDGGALDQGELLDDVIECPRHGGRFNVVTGQAVHMPAVAPVEVFPVKIEGDEIKVGID